MTSAAGTARAAIRRYDDRLGAGLSHPLDHPLCVENILELFRVVIGDYFMANFEPMLQTPPLVIDAEDDHEGRRILRDANLVRAQLILQVEPDHALVVRMSLHSNHPLHAPPFAWPRVTHGAARRCVRGALPGCASPVLAIGGAHLLSDPRTRAGPVGAAQRDRVPEMPSRRLVASTLIRPIVKLPVRSLRRRHLHPYTRRFPSRSEPARCRLLHDLAHAASRGEALTPLAWAGLPAPS